MDESYVFEEHAGQLSWGSYLSRIEQATILRGHNFAAKPATMALDIGCGGGRWSKLLSDLGWKLVCTEIDKRVLDLCQKKLPAAQCILADPEDSTLPGASGRFGILLCMQNAAVMNSPWFPDEAARLLSKGGIIVGTFVNLLSIAE